ncbi:hypothetical protein HYT26_05050 [Candidatus Pacearchaeota archaeon]|nr:hypothetical protein [Candidatus Pacearchaeota archaeon]
MKKYGREECLMPLSLVRKLCSLSNVDIKSLDITYLPKNWGAVKGGKKGIIKMMNKYNSQLKIWRNKGRKKSFGNLKKINYPELNEELAEFIGAYLGDGTITNYFVRISGDYRYDLPYFDYLSELIIRLFGIKPKIYRDKRLINTCYLLISSKNVCSFLKDNYNLKYGDKLKNNSCIPKQILKDKNCSIACLRGLVDTDGSVSRRGRKGSQFCVQFSSYIPELLHQAYNIGRELGIFTYLTGHETGTNKWGNILKYFKVIGSSNLKHVIRFNLRYSKNKTLYVRDVPVYLKKTLYRNMDLPFRMGS